MNKNFKTTGIIIRKINLNEADRIITVLTNDLGKIDLLAKGGRLLKNKFCGRLELFYEVEITGFAGKGLNYLQEIETLGTINESKDVDQHRVLFYMAEFTQRMIQYDQHIDHIYGLLKSTLSQLNRGFSSEIILHTYLIKLLSLIGFLPTWNECAECNEKLDLSRPVYANLDEFHLKCDYCCSSNEIQIESTLVKWIYFMQQRDFEEVIRVKISPAQCQQVWQYLHRALNNNLSYPIKSERFLQQINQ